MFLHALTATDERFKAVRFRPGLNLVVAQRRPGATEGVSRNGTGKSSLVLLLRYLLGGSFPARFGVPELRGWTFSLSLEFPGDAGPELLTVSRGTVGPHTRVLLGGATADGPTSVAAWRDLQARKIFGLPAVRASELTSSSLWAYLIRDRFESPVKAFPLDPDWAAGLKVGYLLGLSPDALAMAREVTVVDRRRKALRAAVADGALAHLRRDEAQLRSELAAARRRRARVAGDLASFRVEDEYEERQAEADRISQEIARRNEDEIALNQRLQEIDRAISEEESAHGALSEIDVRDLYDELGVTLPERVTKRYDDVVAFHRSVIRNRRNYLADERAGIEHALDSLRAERAALDRRRVLVMALLSSSVAFPTFAAMQDQLALLDRSIALLEAQLESVASLRGLDNETRAAQTVAVSRMRSELQERQDFLVSAPLALFGALGAEIYTDRTADLLIDVGRKGELRIHPRISGDGSDGIRSVETFLLDMTLLVTATQIGRAPGLLVHDSHLFDAVGPPPGRRVPEPWGSPRGAARLPVRRDDELGLPGLGGVRGLVRLDAVRA